jgi:hypothetical protein
MTAHLDDLSERILKALVEGRLDDNDITALINIAFKQKETLAQLAQDNERLTQAVADAGEHIAKLEKQIDGLSSLATAHHLVQYAEESSEPALDA